MDDRLSKALDFSKYAVTLSNQKRLLKEKYLESLIVYHNRGQFLISQTLIAHVSALVNAQQLDAVIVDDFDIPIRFDNLEEFLKIILEVYNTTSSEYHNEYEKITKQRSVAGIVELWNQV